MSHHPELAAPKVTVPYLQDLKARDQKIVMITAYNYPTARLADEAGVDLILVGDSLANTALGYDNTLPVTFEEMLIATQSVRRGTRRAMIVADLPFGTFQLNDEEAIRAAIRFVKEGGAEAVKIEGGRNRFALVRQLVENGIPVMGHIGLTPQSVLQMGGYKVQGKSLSAARRLLDDALSLETAGAFALVLEVIPTTLGRLVSEKITIPTIGIGAGVHTDGQVMVMSDMLGLNFGKSAKFVRQYADVKTVISEAVKQYAEDVRNQAYPATQESYEVPAATAEQIEKAIGVDENEIPYVIYAD
ncbi:MAG: 3-methyl-2-oxobutanoate hydroxymethyltransferase [Acidobacteria bacterium]|nr:3-methyl-2-oxobutanoate hydroxymethyltransferase [Acidobacteriota bacterium]